METLPPDLTKALSGNARATAQWQSLTPLARRDFLTWIASAKQEETRKRRAESVPDRLASGKRRPCCYAVVPMNLYKALGGNPKAKAVWKNLTPVERRDFSDWVDAAKQEGTRERRIAKVCALLAAGKRRPSRT